MTIEAMEAVSLRYRFSRAEIVGSSRLAMVVQARCIAVWLIRKKYNLSYPRIGAIIGGRDHSSIIYLYQRAEEFIKRDLDLEAWARLQILEPRTVVSAKLAEVVRKRPSVRKVKPPVQRPQTVLPYPEGKILKVRNHDSNKAELIRQNGIVIASWKLGCAVINQLADRL